MELREAAPLKTKEAKGAHKYRARLIEGERWGSSGFYPRTVLESDGPTAWPEGTPVYLDHPGHQESMDRPERSVRDLAGKITSTPVYEADGLYADIQFYPHTAPVIEALWEDVGMSIRASGTSEAGEAQGKTGPIITSLSEGLSVDVVTKAGAGGKLVSLLESARAPIAESTVNEKRERLQAAIKAAHGQMDRTYTFIRDFDDALVYFELESQDGMTLYQQAYTEQGDAITLDGTATAVIAATTYKPVNPPVAESTSQPPAGQETKTDNEEEPAMGDTNKNGRVDEAQAPPFQKKNDDGQSELERLKAENKQLKAQIAALQKGGKKQEAANIYADAFREAGVDAPTLITALSESAAAGDDDLDVAALTEAAKVQAAEVAAAQGVGTPKGVGESHPIDHKNVTESGDMPSYDEIAAVKGA